MSGLFRWGCEMRLRGLKLLSGLVWVPCRAYQPTLDDLLARLVHHNTWSTLSLPSADAMGPITTTGGLEVPQKVWSVRAKRFSIVAVASTHRGGEGPVGSGKGGGVRVDVRWG